MNSIKKYIMIIFTCMCLVMLMGFPVLAQSIDRDSKVNIVDSSSNIINKENLSRVNSTARGRILSSAGLSIFNDNNGLISVYAETLCHMPVEQIHLIIFLEVWDEAEQDWKYISDYEYTWLASERPGVDLTDVSVSFDVAGLQKGRTYSLRAYHTARDFNNVSEMMATETAGIVLK